MLRFQLRKHQLKESKGWKYEAINHKEKTRELSEAKGKMKLTQKYISLVKELTKKNKHLNSTNMDLKKFYNKSFEFGIACPEYTFWLHSLYLLVLFLRCFLQSNDLF